MAKFRYHIKILISILLIFSFADCCSDAILGTDPNRGDGDGGELRQAACHTRQCVGFTLIHLLVSAAIHPPTTRRQGKATV